MSTCTTKAAQSPAFAVTRMMGLETAAQMLGGQEPLADALGIQPRSLRDKLTARRGIYGQDLRDAADALDQRAARIAEHARKLREAAGA